MGENPNVVKQLRQQVHKQLLECFLITSLLIMIAFSKNLICNFVSGKMDDLLVIRKQQHTFDSVTVGVKENVVPLVVGGTVDLDEVVLERSYQNKVAPAELIFTVLDDTCGITGEKIDDLIHIVGMDRVDVLGQFFRQLVLIVDVWRLLEIVAFHNITALQELF